jgi:molybdate transport system substrate-binding protein
VALVNLFTQWGIAEALQGRLVQAPPGVPVGALVARGEVALGFQQLSELLHVEGVAILGPMPPGAAFDTTFSGAVCAASSQGDAARRLLAFMASAAGDEAKRRNGMEPAANTPQERT